jgi:hypothetical protein
MLIPVVGPHQTVARKSPDRHKERVSPLPGSFIDLRTLVSSGLVVSVLHFMKLYGVLMIRSVSASCGFCWSPGLRFHSFCSYNGPFDKTVVS